MGREEGPLGSLLATVGTAIILTFICLLIYMSWADKLGLPQISVYTAMAIYVLVVFFSFIAWVYHVTHKEQSPFHWLP
jgi:hypothetical protein